MGAKQKGFGKRKHTNFKIAVSKRLLNTTSKNEESPKSLQCVNVSEGEQNIEQFQFIKPNDVVIEETLFGDVTESTESLETSTVSYVTASEENFQQFQFTEPHDVVIKERLFGDVIESTESLETSTVGYVTASEENFQQLDITDVINPENIVIEEMFVNDWMDTFQSLEKYTSNIPTDGIEEIDHLSDKLTNAQNVVHSEHDYIANDEDIYFEEDLLEDQHASEDTETANLGARRFVDIFPFCKAIQNMNSHNPTNSCNFSNMHIVKEFRHGLNSTFTFACDVCKYTGTIKSNPVSESNDQLEVNYAAVLGAYAVGIGFYQCQEFLGTLDVPFMAVATYDKRQKLLQKDLQTAAQKLENDAMTKEKQIAVEKGEVDVNGVPLVSGYADGSYPKRSYRTHYDSLSGTACIIGLHTKKMIWHGVKNKHCQICARTKEGEPKEHVCQRNYVGPSTGIESQLLLEAFENSEKDFGVRYHKLIADGDSKTYKVIDEAKIYRNPTLKVEKIECVLHLNRCAMGLLLKVKGLSSADAEKLLIGIKSSVKHWIASDLSQAEKIENIRKDILNAPHHVFGDHLKCSNYFCDKEKHKNDVNCIPEMKKSGMYNNIMHALARLLENAKSLLYNLNTNFPEQFNSVIAKHLGGKRVNFCTGLSYEGRVDCSSISFNTGRLVSHMKKFLSGNIELNKQTLIYKIESGRLKRRETKAKPGYLRKVKVKHSGTDKHYGTNTCQRPDMSSEVFEMLKNVHLVSFDEQQKDRKNIERQTKDEANSNYREQIQEDVLTADKIGKVCRAATDNDFPSLVESIRYSSETVGNTKEIKHGRIFENTAIELLSEILKLKINSCGIFIDKKYAFLGAHPTGLIDDNGIVLLKCPHSAFKMDINEAVDKRKITFWSLSRKTKGNDKKEAQQVVGINKKHDWFFEIQAMLHITEREFCVFSVWSGHDENSKCIKYEYIYPDESFWSSQMENKILEFYNNHLLPEIIDPRKRRGMPIRGVKVKEVSGKKSVDSGDNCDENGQGSIVSTSIDEKNASVNSVDILPPTINPRKRKGMPIRGVKVKEVSGKKSVDSGDNCDENGQGSIGSTSIDEKNASVNSVDILPPTINPRKRKGKPIRGVKVKKASGKKAIDSGANCDKNGQGSLVSTSVDEKNASVNDYCTALSMNASSKVSFEQ